MTHPHAAFPIRRIASERKAVPRDLMARMGHDSERAAMIYQHKETGYRAALAA